MVRIVTITNPSNNNYVNVWTSIQAVTGVKPTDTYLPDRAKQVIIQAASGNGAAINVADFNSANSAGVSLAASVQLSIGPFDEACIALQELYVKGNALSYTVVIVT